MREKCIALLPNKSKKTIWGSEWSVLYPKPCCNKPSYKVVVVYQLLNYELSYILLYMCVVLINEMD